MTVDMMGTANLNKINTKNDNNDTINVKNKNIFKYYSYFYYKMSRKASQLMVKIKLIGIFLPQKCSC